MMQNLSDDERKDIEDLVGSLKPDNIDEEPADTEMPLGGSNGNSESNVIEAETKEVDVPDLEKSAEITASDLLKVISLQNDRLGILNKKVDVLTRLVELILRANLEEVE